MAKKTKAAKAAAAGAAVKGAKNVKNVRELAQDLDQDELRDNVRVAFEAASDAYKRINGKGAKALFEDPKFHEDVRQAAQALRGATNVVQQPKKKRKAGFGRLLMLGAVGAVAAVALSEGLRNKLLDALFGAEEEFDYTSTTTPGGGSASTGAASTPSTATSPAS